METVQTKRSQRSEHNNDVLLPVNIKKFDDAWSKDVGFYIAFGKGGIADRREKFEKFYKGLESSGGTLESPEVSVNDSGKVMFINGRHRFAVLRDKGISPIYVSFTKDSVDNAKRFGYILSGFMESGGTLESPEVSVNENDYAGDHSAPDKESGAPLNDISVNAIYPADVYTYGVKYYGTGEDRMDWQAFGIISTHRNRPNSRITIFRAVPAEVSGGINRGDWVTIVKAYAVDHGRSSLNGKFRVVQKTVFARDIFTCGDSWLEWGYDPQPEDMELRVKMRDRLRARRTNQRWVDGVGTGPTRIKGHWELVDPSLVWDEPSLSWKGR